tara:strand:- start:2940 stop:3386 length:447 start_codon:yes stop_codon:yes gene_type:complete
MAMSDTEMALMMGANQLAAMRPINPGAFSGVEAGMMPPAATPAMPPATQMARPAMPMPPTAPPGQMPMPSGMPMPPEGNAPSPMDQEGMMRYIQEKARQIRERMGQGSMSDADMGALEAVMRAMPQNQQAPAAGAMSNADMMMQQGAR